MNLITDDELQAHLARRSAEQLSASQRDGLLAAVAAARARPRAWSFRPALMLAPLAAAVVLAVLLYPLLLAIPPAPNASPTSSPTSSPSGSLTVHTAQQLSDMMGDPRWVGHVVLAEARIGNMLAPPPCIEPDPLPCGVAVLGDVSGKNVISVGWYDGSDEGHPDLPRPDDPPGLYAFRVWDFSAEFLGPVTRGRDATVWSVDALVTGDHDQITYDLFAVVGWLVRTQDLPCPRPDLPPDTDLSYECGGAFITATPGAIVETQNGLDPGGLHVQRSAFDEFALNPRSIDVGLGPPAWTSDRGVYLVWPAGQQFTTGGQQPVWRMVGRLNGTQEPAPTPTPTLEATASPGPTISPSPSVPGEPIVYTAQQLSDMIATHNGSTAASLLGPKSAS